MPHVHHSFYKSERLHIAAKRILCLLTSHTHINIFADIYIHTHIPTPVSGLSFVNAPIYCKWQLVFVFFFLLITFFYFKACFVPFRVTYAMPACAPHSPTTPLALRQSRSWRVSKQRAVTDDSLNKSVNMRWLICSAVSSNHSTILLPCYFLPFCLPGCAPQRFVGFVIALVNFVAILILKFLSAHSLFL